MENDDNELTPLEESESQLPEIEPVESTEEPATPQIEDEIQPETGEPIVPLDDEPEMPKEESRARRAFRKFIRWTAGLLIVFGLGFLTAIFTLYTPKVDELGQSNIDLDAAGAVIEGLENQIDGLQDQIDDLNNQIDGLNQEIEDLETENQELQAEQDGFNLHISLLSARADVVSGQVALYEDNPAQARVLLESTSQTLSVIEDLLPEDLKEVVIPLQNRLELAIGEISTDPETAIADLGILAGDLLEIENALFGD
jgi:FtsZ-binding cell division protein ZapB